jgi:hypothetical protein
MSSPALGLVRLSGTLWGGLHVSSLIVIVVRLARAVLSQDTRHCASGNEQLTAGRQISAVLQFAALAKAIADALPLASGPFSAINEELLQHIPSVAIPAGQTVVLAHMPGPVVDTPLYPAMSIEVYRIMYWLGRQTAEHVANPASVALTVTNTPLYTLVLHVGEMARLTAVATAEHELPELKQHMVVFSSPNLAQRRARGGSKKGRQSKNGIKPE